MVRSQDSGVRTHHRTTLAYACNAYRSLLDEVGQLVSVVHILVDTEDGGIGDHGGGDGDAREAKQVDQDHHGKGEEDTDRL